MAKKASKKRRRSKLNLSRKNLLVIGFFGVLLVGFMVWFFISFLCEDLELHLTTSYEFPESFSLNDLYSIQNGNYAIAIDGEIVAGGNFKTKTAEEPGDNEEAAEPKNSGEIYETEEVRPTASTAKMILGLAVMREKPFNPGEDGETITITDEMYSHYVWYISNNGSNTRVKVGEEISEYDALASIFLASSNNMADSLAIWAFGSIDAYREYATSMLREWGLMNTQIGSDASGYHPDTVSTASELAIIGEKVLNDPVLSEIVNTKEHTVPVAGTLTNSNKILGNLGIAGIKTGYIGDASGYCLVSGYRLNDHVITTSLLGATTRDESFNQSLAITEAIQRKTNPFRLVKSGQTVGYYDSWWTGKVKVSADEDFDEMIWAEADTNSSLNMDGEDGKLVLSIANKTYERNVRADHYVPQPSFWERVMHVFGWKNEAEFGEEREDNNPENIEVEDNEGVDENSETEPAKSDQDLAPITSIPSDNYTIQFGYLMLINPNFPVTTNFIDARRSELVSISSLYGIVEGNPNNGDNLLDPEAAKHLNEMVKAYEAAYPGHTFETRSCYRARGTTCGRLCAATGTSDHHTGLTCDLLDPAYGTSLDTDTYDQHIDWQWLYENSYKYGFIDRFPYEWAGGPMSQPANIDENGSTGLFETWHYRFVGVGPATEIATGKYNNGKYDSLEHYLKARGLIQDLKNGN